MQRILKTQEPILLKSVAFFFAGDDFNGSFVSSELMNLTKEINSGKTPFPKIEKEDSEFILPLLSTPTHPPPCEF